MANQAKEALNSAKSGALAAIEQAKVEGLAEITGKLDELFNSSITFLQTIGANLDSLKNLIAEKVETFKTTFETNFAEYLNKSHWSTVSE